MLRLRSTVRPDRACAIGLAALTMTTALTAVAPVPSAYAQAAPEAAERSFDIPAQPLTEALIQFGRQAGLQASADAALIQNLRSAPIRGTMTWRQALNALLSGTGLTWRLNGSMVALERISQEGTPGTIMLDPVTVEGARLSMDSGRTEGTHSYAGSQATVGSKTPATIREIPQSVSVVTRQRIEDRNFTTVDQAMKETTGMAVTPVDQNGYNIASRGYSSAMQIDGLSADRLSPQFSNQFDLAIYDRLEVLRGPSGLFSGGGSDPSGVVNFVHKRPTLDFAFGGAGQVGSWDFYRGEGDVSGPLFNSERVRGRLVVAGQDNDTFVDVTHNRRQIGYGALEFSLTKSTTLLFGADYQNQDTVLQSGLPRYASGQFLDVPRSTFIGADWNRHNTVMSEQFADLEHHFDGGAVVRVAARWLDRSADGKWALSGGPVDPATNTVDMKAYAVGYDQEDQSVDGYFSSPVNLFGQEHEILLGADYRASDGEQNFGQLTNIANINVYSPNHHFAEPDVPFIFRSQTNTEQYGAYGQARVKPIDPLTLIVGGRISWYDTKSTNLLTNAVSSDFSISHEVTPYVGVIVDISDYLSLYGSYSDIFVPQSATAASGDVLPPRIGSQYEAGAKAEFFDKNLIAHLAVFRIEDENRAISDPNNPGFSTAAGEVRSEGFEAEVSGKLTPQWDIYAGYAYTSTKVLSGEAGEAGSVFNSDTPKHLFNLWTKYTFQGGTLDRFNVGGGVRVSSGTFYEDGGVRAQQDIYTVASAQVGYALTDSIQAALSVNNVFDEAYYERVSFANGLNFYGEPRSVWFTIRKAL